MSDTKHKMPIVPRPHAVDEQDRAQHLAEIAEELAGEFVVGDLIDYYCTEEEATILKNLMQRMAEAVVELEEKLLARGNRANTRLAALRGH